MGYTPRAEIFNVTTSIPTVVLQMEIWKKARRITDKMIIKAQKRWAQSKNPPRTYRDGDLVWLEGRNLCYDRTTSLTQTRRTASFPFSYPSTVAHVRYDLATSCRVFGAIRSSDHRVISFVRYDLPASFALLCTISISEPLILQYLVLGEFRSLST